ncbi:hypothetical protein BDZ94DRAFT_1275526 [Collybia nuda]|uniref:BHLH domain-containing protein n=1 Tax=Collybia nuda TaxID=64659 RepID=A0A9P5XTK0_9AGAR|nr:hypothetical protein BDZ94DRAFT_1275526 [Collybia nuda]
MDSQAHDQQQKDFLASLFPDEPTDHLQRGFDGNQNNMSMFPFSASPPGNQQGLGMQQSLLQSPGPQISMDMLGSLMQGIDTHGTLSPQGSFSPQSMLEQQFKLTQLQQLQQLQNQIFQQQIALISSQTAGIMHGSPSIDARRDHQGASYDTGLPTPGPSGKLHAQQSTGDYISSMNLGPYMDPQDSYRNRGADLAPPMANRPNQPHFSLQQGSTSAPAHIAFRTSPSHQSLPSPADADVDISPLTSPWLGAYQQTLQHSSNKRNACSSGDEGSNQPSRKRQSPAIRPTNPTQVKKNYRNSKSTNSTPLLRSSRSRKGSTAGEVAIEEVPGDTPSPVDLSMPPPAPPSTQASSSSSNASDPPASPEFNPQLTPVTPASIMNLGRLGIDNRLTPARQMLPPEMRPKGASKNKASTNSPTRSKSGRKATTGSLASPGLKAILPAGSAPPLNLGPTPALPGPVVQVRKSSHKAAEQKRRDSLKSTFDDLRGLLPPIPLPSDEKPDEPILPGALPPRGPPKAGGEGPNKGVSKLQLLICGNEYIRQLKGRVQRRDEEIEKLRREVRRLRSAGGVAAVMEELEELDLDRDLDAVEALSAGIGRGGDVMMEEEDGEDDGED